MRTRIRRSFLYTPADSRKMMRKAPTVGADAVIYDLEDAVAVEDKDEARENLRNVIPDMRREPSEVADTVELCVRINSLGTNFWLKDLEAAAEADVDTIHISMVERPWHVRAIVETATQLFDDPPEFFLLLETPQGIAYGREIAETSAELPEVTGISFGMSDYAVTIGASQKSTRVREHLNQEILAFANIGNLDPISPVFPDADDMERLREIAESASELGFIGQSVIHPDQVPAVNESFTPSKEAALRAKRLVDAFDSAEAGRTVAEGVFMDEAQVKRYRSRIERYEQITGDPLDSPKHYN